MEIELTPEQDSFVHLGIEQGRFRHAEDAVKDALTLWEKRERARIELLAAIDAGEDSFDGSETVLESDEAITEWMDGLKREGRAGLTKV
jgi:putative addiction module CopG family antidote